MLTQHPLRRLIAGMVVALALAAVAGCGSGGGSNPPPADTGANGDGGDDPAGDGDPGGGGGDGDGGDAGGGSMLEPDFESIQALVFDELCITCHIGATAPLGLRLDSANSYALLVGVASAQASDTLLVDPGNPDASYLIRKLEGTAGTGGQMPLGGTPLPQADIAMIRQWITDGALPPPGEAPEAPIVVSSLSPLPGSTVAAVPMSIMAVFDRELDANTVDPSTFTVVRSGGDGTFVDGNEVAIDTMSVSVPMANPMTAVFDMSDAEPVADTYRVTLEGSGPAVILDLDANALDGEFDGDFPSGDGTAGGDFVAEFMVEGVQPTLQSIQDNVFTPICSECHTGPGGAAGLDLTALTASFTNLVDVPSVEVPALDRVEPGDPDNSYLVQKLEGTAAEGARMPLGGDPLDPATIAAIRQWIADGASM